METAEQAPGPAAPARINWLDEPGDERVREIVTLTDPRHPDQPFSIELESPDPLTDFKAGALANEAIRKYITGDPIKKHPAFPFLVDGEERKTTTQFWLTVAEVAALQPDAESTSLPFEPYTIDELGTLAYKRRGLWLQLWNKARQMVRGAEDALPNA